MGERISQKDIAERTGLSVATVSRSLRNDRSIHPETRARVLEVAATLGYRLPDGRAPKERSLRTLQVLLGETPFDGRAGEAVLAGISEAAATENVQVSVHVVPEGEAQALVDVDGQPPAMRAGVVDGVILLQAFPEEVVRQLCQTMPCVSIVHRHPELPVDCIDCDQTRAFRQMVEHVTACGHREMAFVGWSETSWELLRLAGFREGLFQAGIAHDPTRVAVVGRGEDAGATLSSELDRLRAAGVTAFVCCADPLALEVCEALEERGCSPGTNVLVTGYDGQFRPQSRFDLTTVKVPYRDLGVAAVRRLLRRLTDASDPHRDVLIRHELHYGDTTSAG